MYEVLALTFIFIFIYIHRARCAFTQGDVPLNAKRKWLLRICIYYTPLLSILNVLSEVYIQTLIASTSFWARKILCCCRRCWALCASLFQTLLASTSRFAAFVWIPNHIVRVYNVCNIVNRNATNITYIQTLLICIWWCLLDGWLWSFVFLIHCWFPQMCVCLC